MDDSSIDESVWQFGERALGSTISKAIFREIVTLRRKLHEHPELAFQEVQTAAVVREELRKIEGVTLLDTPAGGTGVLGVIQGGVSGTGKTILFRADMDGLPIQEIWSVQDKGHGGKRRKFAGSYGSCCGLCGAAPPAGGAATEDTAGESTPNTSSLRSWKKLTISKAEGVSHACGHDGHCAMLIGAAKVLAERRNKLKGRVVLLFQPAEERHPHNNPKGGAIRMIRDAAAGEELSRILGASPKPSEGKKMWTDDELHFTDPDDVSMDGGLLDCVDEVYGAHLWNYSSAGTIGCASGSVTANSDSLEITVNGTGGHGSAPQGTVDPVVVASQLIMAMQCIVSRNTSPTESCVITFGKIEGGVAPNVIATSVKILGTVRTFTRPVKRMLQRRLQEIAAGIAMSHGPDCSIIVKLSDGYPACVNSPSCADAVLNAAKGILGDKLVGPPTPNMAGEDFSFLLSRKPGAFFFVGSNPDAKFALDPSVVVEEELEHGSKKLIAHHTPEFDVHEGALWIGAAMWVALAEKLLKPC